MTTYLCPVCGTPHAPEGGPRCGCPRAADVERFEQLPAAPPAAPVAVELREPVIPQRPVKAPEPRARRARRRGLIRTALAGVVLGAAIPAALGFVRIIGDEAAPVAIPDDPAVPSPAMPSQATTAATHSARPAARESHSPSPAASSAAPAPSRTAAATASRSAPVSPSPTPTISKNAGPTASADPSPTGGFDLWPFDGDG
ncbi:hypothetical protein AB0M28_38070 [Streptomyces sp. NPDC051940]|uniref:hypothetical protein n=1 Tax=Streptomyces sp. NPDC051940 TaxID=3155675 RepID=UPI003426917F